MNYQYLDSPIGRLRLVSNGTAITRIDLPGLGLVDAGMRQQDDPLLASCRQQLQAYFARRRRHFDLPLAPAGTPFQLRVWQQLRAIPYGELRSYREVAESIGNAAAVRAVGAANGRNPIPVVVPCHRVIGSDGSLTGFAGGLAAKQQLLELEAAVLPQRRTRRTTGSRG
jgi:methylated-DNA-[protein]-cysteine S-methyltransferase